ncbi:hypothetical protein H5410_005421 [Solanum commersonii]|uniref:CCHC-type domain-containing protein n=1 Tax=Solanum commersonii TaxID=4109 RepID=A0A9J6A7D9_SOLCO|nr:hypothetical protein H5410_005421 [Solanum commersonii]
MAQINFSTVWIRLPELPTEFYDLNFLQQIGNQILKIDRVTMNTTRGRYARLCILAPLSRTLPRDILIGTHLQKIQYEPSTALCTICGRLGHLVHSCPNKPNNIPSTSKNPNRTEPSPELNENAGWQTVVYPKKKRANIQKTAYKENNVQLNINTFNSIINDQKTKSNSFDSVGPLEQQDQDKNNQRKTKNDPQNPTPNSEGKKIATLLKPQTWKNAASPHPKKLKYRYKITSPPYPANYQIHSTLTK